MGTAHRVGYARVSTLDQKPELQLDALKGAGCKKVFVEKVWSSKEVRPQLAAALEHLRSGDTLVVWKLDRLARSMKQLLETVDMLKGRGVGFQSLTEAIDTTSAAGERWRTSSRYKSSGGGADPNARRCFCNTSW